MCTNCLGIGTGFNPFKLWRSDDKIEYLLSRITSFTELQNQSFYLVDRKRKTAECAKKKKPRTKRTKSVFSNVKYEKFVTILLSSTSIASTIHALVLPFTSPASDCLPPRKLLTNILLS